MAPNGPQNDKNAIQTLQITIFRDNSGAAQIPQTQMLFAPKIAANTNRIRITRIWLIPKYEYEYYSYLLTALTNRPDLMWLMPDLMGNMRKHKLGMLNIGGHKNSHGKHKKT